MGIERPAFPVVRLREGYDAEQVDRAVASVLEDLALPQPGIGRDDVAALRFTPVRRGGYDMTAVDDWFDRVAGELDQRAGVPAGPAAEPHDAPDVIVDLDASDTGTDSERVELLVKVAVLVVAMLLLYLFFA